LDANFKLVIHQSTIGNYLVARDLDVLRDEEKDRMATFALSRFREVEGTGAIFPRAPDFDARTYAREAFGITRGGKTLRMRLCDCAK